MGTKMIENKAEERTVNVKRTGYITIYISVPRRKKWGNLMIFFSELSNDFHRGVSRLSRLIERRPGNQWKGNPWGQYKKHGDELEKELTGQT